MRELNSNSSQRQRKSSVAHPKVGKRKEKPHTNISNPFLSFPFLFGGKAVGKRKDWEGEREDDKDHLLVPASYSVVSGKKLQLAIDIK